MAAHGGKRDGGGRPKGSKNKATILREQGVAEQIDAARKEGRRLPTEVLEKLMELAEGATAVNRPTTQADLNKGIAQNPDGDWTRFGEWFDRTVYCAKELAKYRQPQIKAVDAPAPPPDPRDLEQKSRKRFGLRVFEGGKLAS